MINHPLEFEMTFKMRKKFMVVGSQSQTHLIVWIIIYLFKT